MFRGIVTWGTGAGTCHLKKAGETDERLCAVAAWREAPCFSEAERAALALTEAVTRLSDRADPVPDAIREEAARHYDEPALAALILSMAVGATHLILNLVAPYPEGIVQRLADEVASPLRAEHEGGAQP